jgi:hypothetical protein
MAVGGDALGGGGDGDGGSQFPGILLSSTVLAVGLLLLVRAPAGPLRTAGSAASVLAVPALLFFLTFDEGNVFEPFSGDAVVIVSAATWLALHVWGPAAGRTFPLSAGLIAAWLGIIQLVETEIASPLDLLSYAYLVLFLGWYDSSDLFGEAIGAPDTDALAVVSLIVGVAVVLVGRRLDRRGEQAQATAFATASVGILFFGALFLVGSIELIGAGIVLAGIGGLLAADGASRQRRGTTWSGAVLVVAGAVLALFDAAGDSATSFGVAAAVVGIGIVAGSHVLATALGEPDELAPGPSTFRTPPAAVTDPPAPPTP